MFCAANLLAMANTTKLNKKNNDANKYDELRHLAHLPEIGTACILSGWCWCQNTGPVTWNSLPLSVSLFTKWIC